MREKKECIWNCMYLYRECPMSLKLLWFLYIVDVNESVFSI